MPRKFWEEEVEKQMIGEGFDNFSSYISFLLKLRRENLHQRRIEVARLEGKPIGESAAAALNEKEQPDPKRKAV